MVNIQDQLEQKNSPGMLALTAMAKMPPQCMEAPRPLSPSSHLSAAVKGNKVHRYATFMLKPARSEYSHSRQSGIVLFMALIALVAMSFAALALVRSVDTSNLVAGNVALRQGAIQEADAGMNQAFKCMVFLLTPGAPEGNYAPCNYRPSLQPDISKPFGVPDELESIAILSLPLENPITHNTTRFMIERLCNEAGQWKADKCLDSPWGGKGGAGWHDIRVNGTGPTAGMPSQLSVPQALYRISVKVSGPHNQNAYSQVIVNGPR